MSYKRLMVLEGSLEYEHHFNSYDQLSDSQKNHLDSQWKQFRQWWHAWSSRNADHLNQ